MGFAFGFACLFAAGVFHFTGKRKITHALVCLVGLVAVAVVAAFIKPF